MRISTSFVKSKRSRMGYSTSEMISRRSSSRSLSASCWTDTTMFLAPTGFPSLIHHGHLGLAIRADATNGPIVHCVVQPSADVICEYHRDWQASPGFPGGVAVHGALVAGAGGGEHILAAAAAHLKSGIHAAGDVGTLPVDIDEHNKFHGVVAHLAEDLPNHRADVDFCRTGDLPQTKIFPLVAITSQAQRE